MLILHGITIARKRKIKSKTVRGFKTKGENMVGKIMKAMIAAGVSLGVISLLFTIFCNLQLRIDRKIYSVDQTDRIDMADYAIVPGCLVYKNGKPSYALEDRLNGALKLYQEKKVPKIILSGAARENEAGRIFLMNRGVFKEDILIDDGGLDTYSTIYRCKEAFKDKKFIVCTQKKYFKRTGYLISKLGMNGYCMGIDKHQYKKEIYERFRDFFASDKAWIECNITKPEPVYSLKKLPIK